MSARATRSFTEPGRVDALELGEDPDRRVRRHPGDLDERRVADRLEDARVAVARRRAGRRRRRRTRRVARLGRQGSERGHRRSAAASAARHRRQEADLVALADRRREPVEVADVLAVQVDVDEPVELAVGRQELAAEAGVARDERVRRPRRRSSPRPRAGFAPPTLGRRTGGIRTTLMPDPAGAAPNGRCERRRGRTARRRRRAGPTATSPRSRRLAPRPSRPGRPDRAGAAAR